MTTTQKNTPFHIVASDLDGTLLAPNHQLSAFSKQTLKALHQKGFTFIFATGRHHIDVASIREVAGIPAYMITSNGARVHDQNNQLMYSHNVPPELVQPVIDIVRQNPDIFIHLYRDDDWLLDRESERLAKFHSESGFSYQRFNAAEAPCDGIVKVFFTHPQQDHQCLVEFETRLREQFGDQLNITFSTPWCLEIVAAEVSKGNALEAIANSLNMKLENCIAFGDGMNDAEMLQMAGKGLVMGGAHQTVKQALPDNEVIGNNSDDAVAHYLHDHLF